MTEEKANRLVEQAIGEEIELVLKAKQMTPLSGDNTREGTVKIEVTSGCYHPQEELSRRA